MRVATATSNRVMYLHLDTARAESPFVMTADGTPGPNVLRDLRRRGRVVYDHTNPTFTSSRRLTRGALYGMVVTVLVYYLLAYHLNRLFGRTVIGSAPAFRDEPALVPFINCSTCVAIARRTSVSSAADSSIAASS